ncbi:hypothetical protein PR048_030170 [Dryococelus australis]|uniref:Uncharacterized protein n=1 Tax=Dryococelus australis TaxID=614101 RepID=A0ABQ9GAU0_9NEOP|nr:hypothetical protein PR048_030170 [Dryococelus australis]
MRMMEVTTERSGVGIKERGKREIPETISPRSPPPFSLRSPHASTASTTVSSHARGRPLIRRHYIRRQLLKQMTDAAGHQELITPARVDPGGAGGVGRGEGVRNAHLPRMRDNAPVCQHVRILGATVAERLARSPPTKANRAQSPIGSPDFRKWESCRRMPLAGVSSRGSPASPVPSLRRRSIFNSITPQSALKTSLLRAQQEAEVVRLVSCSHGELEVPNSSVSDETHACVVPTPLPHHTTSRDGWEGGGSEQRHAPCPNTQGANVHGDCTPFTRPGRPQSCQPGRLLTRRAALPGTGTHKYVLPANSDTVLREATHWLKSGGGPPHFNPHHSSLNGLLDAHDFFLTVGNNEGEMSARGTVSPWGRLVPASGLHAPNTGHLRAITPSIVRRHCIMSQGDRLGTLYSTDLLAAGGGGGREPTTPRLQVGHPTPELWGQGSHLDMGASTGRRPAVTFEACSRILVSQEMVQVIHPRPLLRE